MLLDPRPKETRRELFDRGKELAVLDNAASRCIPLVQVLGIRRIGKTSLLKSFLEEWRGVYIDLRGVRTTADLYNRVADGLEESLGKLRSILRGIRGRNL